MGVTINPRAVRIYIVVLWSDRRHFFFTYGKQLLLQRTLCALLLLTRALLQLGRAHGPPLQLDTTAALKQTAEATDEISQKKISGRIVCPNGEMSQEKISGGRVYSIRLDKKLVG